MTTNNEGAVMDISTWAEPLFNTFTEADVVKVLNDNPMVTYDGWGVNDGTRKTAQEHADRYEKSRALAFKYVPETTYLANWMGVHMEPIKTINKKNSSYGLKHLVEHFVPGTYVSNGQFVCAALVVGFNMMIDPNCDLNPRFGISEKSIKRIRSVRVGPENRGRGHGTNRPMLMPPRFH